MFLLRLLTDPFRMIAQIRRIGGAIDAWGAALNIPQAIGGLVFIATIEGRTILATLIVTLIVAGQIHRRLPFSRLTGLCHLPWLALLPWLVVRLPAADGVGPFEIWLGYVCVTIAISLVFDARDLALYRRGETTYAWAGGAAGKPGTGGET